MAWLCIILPLSANPSQTRVYKRRVFETPAVLFSKTSGMCAILYNQKCSYNFELQIQNGEGRRSLLHSWWNLAEKDSHLSGNIGHLFGEIVCIWVKEANKNITFVISVDFSGRSILFVIGQIQMEVSFQNNQTCIAVLWMHRNCRSESGFFVVTLIWKSIMLFLKTFSCSLRRKPLLRQPQVRLPPLQFRQQLLDEIVFTRIL